MNNLTPLQALTAQIYCAILQEKAFINANSEIAVKGEVSFTALRKSCIIHAKALLEATKPEPLEWYKQAEAFHQSGIEYFTIAEYYTDINGDKLENIEYQLRQDGKLIGYFFDLDIAKQFAEHIRTR